MLSSIPRPSLVRIQPKHRCQPGAASPETRSDAADASVAAALSSLAADQPPSAAGAARRRVLVVDNEPACTRLARLTLERCGLFDVCEVNDPLRALATARRFQPHLVLLDIEMPGLDGSSVAKQLRAENDFRHLPILFMTSLITQEEADQYVYAAGSRVLAKPVTLSKLLQSVAEMLGNLLANGLPKMPAPAI